MWTQRPACTTWRASHLQMPPIKRSLVTANPRVSESSSESFSRRTLACSRHVLISESWHRQCGKQRDEAVAAGKTALAISYYHSESWNSSEERGLGVLPSSTCQRAERCLTRTLERPKSTSVRDYDLFSACRGAKAVKKAASIS